MWFSIDSGVKLYDFTFAGSIILVKSGCCYLKALYELLIGIPLGWFLVFGWLEFPMFLIILWFSLKIWLFVIFYATILVVNCSKWPIFWIFLYNFNFCYGSLTSRFVFKILNLGIWSVIRFDFGVIIYFNLCRFCKLLARPNFCGSILVLFWYFCINGGT